MIEVLAVHSLLPDPAIQKYLARVGGSNLYGAPNFRVVWSGNRTKLSLRKWTDNDASGNFISRRTGWGVSPKYNQPARRERFIIELFKPAEQYGSPELWYYGNTKYVDGEMLNTAGPYPHRGDYEYIDTCEWIDAEGERHFLQPTEGYVDMVLLLHRKLLDTTEQQFAAKRKDEYVKKREADRDLIYERIKNDTSPYAFTAHAAISNLAALEGSADYLARNTAAPAI